MQQNDGKSVKIIYSCTFFVFSVACIKKSSTFAAYFYEIPFGTPKIFADFI